MGGDREDEEPTDADPEPPDDAGPPATGGDADPTIAPDDGPPVSDSTVDDEIRKVRADDPTTDVQHTSQRTVDGDGGGAPDGSAELATRADREPAAGDDTADPGRDPEALEDIDGIGDAKADALRDAGFDTVDDVRSASADELTEVSGIGDALAARIKADVGEPEPAAGEEPAVIDESDGASPVSAEPVEEDEPLLSGPESDEEMPLTAHIEEMVKRLAIVVAIAGAVSLVTFPFAERIINFLWYNIMPGVPSDIARPRLYGVLELMFTKLKVASLAGLIVALPALVYETYQFMRPGLYPHERRYYLAAIPASLVLALVGVSFAYFIVLPAIFTYFLAYSQDVATIGFALGQTFNLILVLMGYLALVFQIPLFIMLSMMMGLVTRRWLANRRLLFWGAFLGVSFLFSPDPTGMAPVIIALTMVGLFEGTLLLTKWAGRE